MKDRLIVALDVDTFGKAKKIVNMLKKNVNIYKIGSILFTREGPAIVKYIKKLNKKVFLDLKYHDIPNTVGMAVKQASELGADILTIHTSGGLGMMKEAVKNKGRTLVFGVTVLTSTNNEILKKEMGVEKDVKKQVIHLAKFAKKAGLDGVVASGEETQLIRKACGSNFLIITPGVRPAGGQKGDQKRVVTPAIAIKKGANFIVVGRPIIQSDDPAGAAKAILNEISGIK